MTGNGEQQSGTGAGVLYRYRHWLAGLAMAVLVYAVLGFLVAPWLISKNAIEYAQVQYDSTLRLDNVAVNPFTLTLAIDGLAFDDPNGETLARARHVFANLQASSLFRRALTLAEFRVDEPELSIKRSASGNLNIAYLFEADEAEPAVGAADEDREGLPRILIFEFAINQSSINWDDRLPSDPVSTQFGPVDIRVLELSTLPQTSGQQTVVITTESSGTLSWTGELQLNPLRSAGSAGITGSHFGLVSRYLKQQTGFNILEGQSDVGLDYVVAVDDDGNLDATVSNLRLRLSDLLLHKTDPGDAFTQAEDRRVLTLPLMEFAGGQVEWPERRASFESLVLDSADVAVYRDVEERVNWLPDDPADSAAPFNEPAAEEEEWELSLAELEVRSMVIGIVDHSVSPAADIGLDSLDLLVTDISNAPGAAFPTRADMVTRAGGTLSLEGETIVLPETAIDYDLSGQGISLSLLHPYIQPLADVNLDSGALAVSINARSNSEETLAVSGDFAIEDFLITETDEGSRLGSWDRLDVSSLELSITGNTLSISEMRFAKSYADIFIAEDGTVNLGRVEKGEQSANDDDDSGTTTDDADQSEGADDDIEILIGRVIFDDAGADFADESLPLPFSARIAELSGEISTIATASREPSEVALEGKVDEHGFVSVSGSITPLDPAKNTNLDVAFQNVEMPKFSAYSIPFAGREIANGRLDLDLGYKVVDSRLEGENRIVLHDFELGDKVEHPGAMSLPLGLAVALLKDPSGKIDIDLPVRGDLNDPEFRYGGLILKALGNLIVKIVTSPFALLGNLIGVEADELSQVNFIAGRSDLTPPELERTGKIAEALALRPQLVLEVPGVVDREADSAALAAAMVDGQLEERIGADADGSTSEMYAEQKQKALEALFAESGIAADDEAALGSIRAEHTTTPVGDDGESGGPEFDTVAYMAELRRQLIEQQDIPEEVLVALANERATNVRDAIVTVNPEMATRITITQPKAVERGKEESIPMEVTLSADGVEAEPVGSDTAGPD